VFQDPETLEMIGTDEVLHADESEWSFNNKVYHPYYENRVGSWIETTKTSYDENGVETSDPAMVKTVRYKVQVQKRLDTPSFANVNLLVDPANTSTISLVKPTEVGGSPSSAPLSGNFRINCPDPLNPSAIAQTEDISWAWSYVSIHHEIERRIPFLAGRMRVAHLNVRGQSYYENARRFALIFEDMDVDMPQCYLTTGVEEPLGGENPRFEAMTLTDFGENLFF
jgi:hypothetical protein